ncbi:MAG: hypothetical protein QF561_06375 [Phycisphaerales bacterium]|jgi:hypothetical protein|nr:hypothetical protein [Phycisphaerales bacterium]
MTDMHAPFRLHSNLARVVDRGYAFPLGVERGGLRPRRVGWSRRNLDGDMVVPDVQSYTIVVSHERVRPLIWELLRSLPTHVAGMLELGSRDAYREVDVYLGSQIPSTRFRGTWDLFEPIFLEDASLGVGVYSPDPYVEVFLDPDKRILVHVHESAASGVEHALERLGVVRRSEEDLQPMRSASGLAVRPVLQQVPGLMSDTDDLLMELRAAWDLALDEDPDRNLDARGRDIGYTMWRGLVFVDQEDPAGRRFGHAHIWGVATCRRDMQQLIERHISGDYEWEFRELLNLDRVAWDDRPAELNDVRVAMDRPQVLVYNVDIIGTGPERWDVVDE